MDTIRAVKRSVMLESWKASYDEYKSSGMTMRSWCHQNGIPVSTFTYRLRELRAEALLDLQDRCEASVPAASSGGSLPVPAPVINLAQVELPKPAGSQTGTIHIRRGETELDLTGDIPKAHLRLILEVMFRA